MSVLLRMSTVFLLALSVFLSAVQVSSRPQFSIAQGVKKREVSEVYTTNAARMAAGLGPMIPRNLFNPTRMKMARDPQTSQPATLTGRVEVNFANGGGFVGYVNKNYDSSKRLDLKAGSNGQGDDLTVSFTQPASTSSLFNILITNGNANQLYLGYALDTTSLQHYIPPNPSHYFTTLTGTNQTPAGGIASTVGNGMSSTNAYSESPIWSYDSSNGKLSSKWLNPTSPGYSTGTPVTVHNYLAPDGSLVQSISDLTGQGYTEVVFTLV